MRSPDFDEQLSNQSSTDGFRLFGYDGGDVLHLLREHWRQFFWVPVAAGAALIYCLVATPMYTTSAMLYLLPNFDKDLDLKMEENGSANPGDQESLHSIEKAVISDSVILGMVNRLRLREDPGYLMKDLTGKPPLTDAQLLKTVRKRYEAELIPTTRVLKLMVSDPSAERARVIAQTLKEEFLVQLQGHLKKEGIAVQASLKVQGERALEEAMKSESALQDFRVKNPDFLMEQDSDVFQQRVIQYGQELNQAKAASARLKGMVDALMAVDAEKNPFQVFEIAGTKNNSAVSELLRLHTAAETELAAAKQIYGVKNPKYRVAEETLLQVQRSVRSYAKELSESAVSDYNSSVFKAEKLDASLRELQKEFVTFKTKSAQFRGLKAEVDKNWSVHSEIQKKIMNLALAPEVFPMFAIPLSEPVVPDKPSFPSNLKFTGGALVFSLMMIVGLLLWTHRNSLPFIHAGQVEALMGVPVIGVCNRPLAQLPGAPQQEGASKLFGLPVALGCNRTIHLASLGQTENFDWIPVSLGESFAHSGSKTVLVQVREASAGIHSGTAFPVPARIDSESGGTADLWTVEVSISSLVHREQFRAFVEGLSGDYERVLIDTTGIGEREAILAVAEEVEANVWVVAENGIRRAEFASFANRIPAEVVETVMAVFVPRSAEAAAKGAAQRQALQLRSVRRPLPELTTPAFACESANEIDADGSVGFKGSGRGTHLVPVEKSASRGLNVAVAANASQARSHLRPAGKTVAEEYQQSSCA